MVNDLNYIGPFLRLNPLTIPQIKSQLFHLAKESMKHVVLSSKCGVTIPMKELKTNTSNIDINIINSFSPLLCVYKKANPKIEIENGLLYWNEDGLKKEIHIGSNAYMTLAILELANYYAQFADKNSDKYAFCSIYMEIAKKQLEFFATNLRNEEGLFVDKKDVSNSENKQLMLKEKNSKFKFSDQAFLMAAYYKYSLINQNNSGEEFKKFSYDILNMFLQFKDDLYSLSLEEISKLCLALNIFTNECTDIKAKALLLDMTELLVEQCESTSYIDLESSELELMSIIFINLSLFLSNTGIVKFNELQDKIYNKLISYYNSDLGMFINSSEAKEIIFSSSEIILYTYCILLHYEHENNDDDKKILIDIFKRQISDSGIVLGWPDVPDLNDVERYKNFTLKSEDLLEEQYFKMPSNASTEKTEAAPIFIKYVTFNIKNESFKQGKSTFDSSKNMFLFFIIIYLDKYFQKEQQV